MTEIVITSEITVELIDTMGGDKSVSRAAWVRKDFTPPTPKSTTEGVIGTMMEKRHGTPFEAACFQFHVHAPIKVWREHHRHRIGWSYNEESGRYKTLEPVFYVPPRDRPIIRPEGFKSMNPKFNTILDDGEYEGMVREMKEAYADAYNTYELLLAKGVDRGLARDVLGVGIYSSCITTCNARSLMAFLELRTTEETAKRPSKPLYEIEVVARKYEAFFAERMPVTYAAWVRGGRMAP
jgi:thymidylate synthase (FAD)